MSKASKLNDPALPAESAPGEEGTASEALGGVYDLVDRSRLIDRLAEMIEIPSVNPFDESPRPGCRELELAEYYLDQMSALGTDVGRREVVNGRPNVWGVLKGSGDGPSLMLSGHLDTVGVENYADALTARVADGRVYGRGSCDMKAGLSAYLEVARLVREADIELRGDLVITGLVDEEHLMLGSRALGQYGPWADYGIIGEPSDLMICPAHKGQVGFRIRTLGTAAHSSQPEHGTNAIASMAKVIEAIQSYARELMTRRPHQLCGHARSCPSVIRGGTIVSTVPDACELEVDRRTLPGETTSLVESELRQLLEQLAAEVPNLRYDIDGPTIEVAPLDLPLDNPVVRSILTAHQRVLGDEGPIHAFPGGTDAPNLGFPTVVCGPGSVLQAHTTNEYVEIEDLVNATKLYLCTALDLLSAELNQRAT